MNAPIAPQRIEYWPLARLKPYASMAEFGWTVPVLIAADSELIAGH